MGEFVRLEVTGGVGTVRLDRPPVNAVNRQVQDEMRVLATEAARASQFAGGPARALAAATAAIDGGLDVDLHTGLAIESDAFAALFATEDQHIGMTSFLANGPGKASFTGR